MTSQYIITEEQLNDLMMYEDSEHDGKYAPICNEIRSRPYNPQADREKEAHEHGWFTDWEMQQAELKGYNKGNADGQDYARKAEREKVLGVLDELEKFVEENVWGVAAVNDGLPAIWKYPLMDKISELRKQEGK